ncbi:1-phosphofructokinase [Haloferax namakaokahaiae]|uniref:1-phosphofructokinase n=1 Tax=Haloferax namakaokahaiae TaxID=1748331 RepID=A0ABD5ZFF0_9EURY
MILTVTPNPAVDHTIRFDEPLTTDVVHRTDDAVFTAGGKGINVAKYTSALGVDATASGFLGGHFGRLIQDRLDAADVAADFVPIDTNTRLNTTVVASDGEYKLNHNGPHIDADEVDQLVSTVRANDPETLHIGGSLPPGMPLSAIDRLADAGDWRTAIDTGGETLTKLEADYFICKPNESELADATGRSVETVDEAIEAAEALREYGYEYVLASLGGDGAVLVGPDGAFSAPALDVEVVDTVGAGDALLSGFLAGRGREMSDVDSLRLGVRTAAHIVSVAGTHSSDLGQVLSSDVPVEILAEH